MAERYTYVPVMYEGRQAYEVIAADGRGTGIIRDTRHSANGTAYALNNNIARALARKRAREAECRST